MLEIKIPNISFSQFVTEVSIFLSESKSKKEIVSVGHRASLYKEGQGSVIINYCYEGRGQQTRAAIFSV